MKYTLKILYLYHEQSAFEEIRTTLENAQICFEAKAGSTKENLRGLINDFTPDIILSEQNCCCVLSSEALDLLKAERLMIPFILISDHLPIEEVSEIINAGASDYVSKNHLERLPVAIHLALKKHRLQIEREEYVQKVETAESRFRSLIEHAVDAVVILDPEGKTIYASPSIKRVMGYTEEEAIGLCLYNVVHPDDLEMVKERMQECLKNPGISLSEIQCRCLHKNGNWVWYEGTITNLIHDPAINGIVDNFHEITEKKSRELDLKESEERYKFLFEYSTTPKWIFDLETQRILDVNDTAVKTYGYSREELLTMITNDLKPPEELERLAKVHAELKNMEGLLRFGIYTQVKKDGTKIKAEVSGHKVMYKNRPCMVIDSFDVTEREKTLAQLKDSEEKLMTAQRIAKLGYWKCDLNDFQIYWSEEIYNIFGVEKESFSPTLEKLMESIHPDDRENYYKNREETFHKQKDHECEYRIIVPGGTVKWVHEYGKFVKNNEGVAIIFEGTAQDISSKRLLEQSLEESNLRYEMVSKATSDAIWDWDFKTNKAYWGEGFETLFGYDRIDLEKDNFWESKIHPEDKERVINNLEASIKTQQLNWSDEYRFRKADNSYAYVLDKGFFTRDEDGNALKLAGGMQDITKGKELEELLDKANSLARIGSFEYNVNNNSMYWSDITKQIHEVESYYVLTEEKVKDFYQTASDLETINKAFENAVQKGNSFDVELPITTGKGNSRWIRVIGETEFINGRCARVYGSVQDIDQRKKAEEALRISNNRYSMVAKATNDSIWDWDFATNTVERPDKPLESLLGYEHIAPFEVDDFWQSHVHPDDWKRITESRNRLFENPNENYWEDEYRFLKPDGSYAIVYDRGYIIRNKEGKAVRMIGASRDISKLKENEIQLKILNEQLEARAKELVASNQELEQFAYVASHDLQEPLRMVSNFLTQIEKKYYDILDEKGKTYIHFAVDGAQRMRQMILDLLEFSRAGRKVDERKQVNLNILVKEILNLHQKQVEETKAIVKVGELPVIAAPQSAIRQVFQNLISNSLKYNQLKKGIIPEISISSKDHGNEWQFEVKDNGIGIDKQYFERVFVIFQRLHDRSEYSGTGIGLAITKKIIENMHGNIWIESEPGKGTSFFFTLPK
ncbi:MAG TPA: PAS domain-containing protein [Hanamia sp.]|nr:PAS domain-containing protein [Hanamia sp.]